MVKNNISVPDRARLRAETGCDEQTIRHYPNVRAFVARRIEEAAARLGIALPSDSPSKAKGA